MKDEERALYFIEKFGDKAEDVVYEIIIALTDYGEESEELQNMDSEFRWWNKILYYINSQNK